jgi:hypothetical protein
LIHTAIVSTVAPPNESSPMNPFQNANTLAHSVNSVIDERLSPRPYNRFDPNDTVWWLVPSPEWPAYKFGKLFFDSRPERVPDGNIGIFSGFYVESGLSRKVREFYPKEVIQQDDWLWERFSTQIMSELPTLTTPQFVSVLVSFIPIEKAKFMESPESFFAQKDSFEASRVAFTLDANQQLGLLSMKTNEISHEIAEHFRSRIQFAKTLGTLLADLRGFPQSDWAWVDVHIGTVARNGSPERLWKDYLEPWTPWLTSAATPAGRGR